MPSLFDLISGRIDPIEFMQRDELEAGYIRAEDIEQITGPLPGSDDLPDPGHIGMGIESFKEGFLGPLAGLAERLGILEEGTHVGIRENFEERRLGYLSENPSIFRAIVAGGTEFVSSAIPIVPGSAAATKLGGLAGRLGTRVTERGLRTAVGAAEGGLLGLGETAGYGPEATALGVGLGTVLGGVAGRFVAPELRSIEQDFAAIEKGVQKWFKTGGVMGGEISEINQRAMGRIRDQVLEARANSELLKDAVLDYSRISGKSKKEIELLVNKSLITRTGGGGPGTGKQAKSDVDLLPEPLRTPARRLRDHIDELSEEISNSQYVTDELKNIIKENRGIYMRMSHAAFDDPTYREFIRTTPEGKTVWADTFDFIKKETKWDDDEVTALMDKMLDDPMWDREAFVRERTKGTGRIDRKTLKHRKQIDTTIRNFLGLYSDPYVNYLKSVASMANNVSWGKAFNETFDFITETGQGYWGVRPRGEYVHEITGARTPLSGEVGKRPGSRNLKQLFLKDRDLADAINGMHETSSLGMFATVNAMTKIAKTVLSPQTHFRNFLSGHLMMTMQGHSPFFRANRFRTAFSPVDQLKKAFGDQSTTKAMEAYRVLVRRGVIGEGLLAEDVDFYLRQAQKFLDTENKGKQALKKFSQWTAKKYQAEDDFWKVSLYLKEYDRYKKALPDFDPEEISKRAADVVNGVMQIYSKVPLISRKIREFPLTGPFISFPSEIIRNVVNTFRLISKESFDPNPAIRRIGIQRGAGMLSTMAALGPALGMFGRFLTNRNIDQENALRSFIPPWSENSQIMLLPGGDSEKGEVQYFDLSFMDPYNYLKKPMKAFMRAVTSGNAMEAEQIIKVLDETLDPAISPEIFWSELNNLVEELGKMKKAPVSTKAKEIAYRAYRAFAPGAAISFERFVRGLDQKGIKEVLPSTSRYGKKYDLLNEVVAFVGPRISTVNVQQAFQYRAREYASARRQASRIYNLEARNKEARSAYKLLNKKKEAELTNRKAANDILKYIEDAKLAGDLTRSDLFKELTSAGISKNDASMLLNGKIPRMRFRL